MKNVKIKRFNDSGDEALGVVIIDDIPFCLSLEQSWNENKVSQSCIPTGEYVCKWHKSPKYGWCYIVTEVEGRSHILFHAGNTRNDTRGCILLGDKIGQVFAGGSSVLNSRKTIKAFHQRMQKSDFKLTIE